MDKDKFSYKDTSYAGSTTWFIKKGKEFGVKVIINKTFNLDDWGIIYLTLKGTLDGKKNTIKYFNENAPFNTKILYDLETFGEMIQYK